MEDFVKRMIEEQKELSQTLDRLKDRIDKIETFLNFKQIVRRSSLLERLP